MMMCCMLGLALGVHAQESVFLQQYREKVKAYNQDIKSAGYAVSIRQEAEKSAKADFLPSLSGNANASYTGNPLELYRELPSIETPLYFQGRDTKYGASVTLLQPVYSGGALKAGLEKSRKEKESALYEEKRVTNDVLYQADQYYWNKVACEEMVEVAAGFKESVAALVEVVRYRVEEEYTDRNDLLMAEVKLNDAEFRLEQARNETEVARLSMNSFSGEASDKVIQTDSLVVPLTEELQFLDTYVLLQKVRLGDCLQVDNRIADKFGETPVPPLSLQLLVENVIKHNVISMKKPMTVKMWTEPQGDDVWICVANAVRPKQGGVTSGKGLENLSQRYRLLCGKEIVIEQNEKEFIVKLPLLYDQD